MKKSKFVPLFFFVYLFLEILKPFTHFIPGGVKLTERNDVFCGNCGLQCGVLKKQFGVNMINLTKFRMTVDIPCETMRVCERVSRRLRSHGHHYVTHIITGEIKSKEDLEKFEKDYHISLFSKCFDGPMHNNACRVISPCGRSVLLPPSLRVPLTRKHDKTTSTFDDALPSTSHTDPFVVQKRKCSPTLPKLITKVHTQPKVRVIEKPLDLSLNKKNITDFDVTESSSDDSVKINVAKALCALRDSDNSSHISGESSQQHVPAMVFNNPNNPSNIFESSIPNQNVQDMNLVSRSSKVDQPMQTMVPLCEPSTSREPVRLVNLVNQSSGFLPYPSGGLISTRAPFTSDQMINVSHDTRIPQNTFIPIRAPMLMNQNMPFCPITTIGSLNNNPFTQNSNFSPCLPIYTGHMTQNMTAITTIPVTAVATSVGIASSGSPYGNTTSKLHVVNMNASASTGLSIHHQPIHNVQPMNFGEQQFINQSAINQTNLDEIPIHDQTVFEQFFDNLLKNVDPRIFDSNDSNLIDSDQSVIDPRVFNSNDPNPTGTDQSTIDPSVANPTDS